MNITDLQDTIVALSTPVGQGAIGVIRLSGKKAIAICNDVFYGTDLSNKNSHTLHFGTIRKDDKILDEVVVGLFKAPNSYTRENVVEVSCHGSSYILESVLRLFLEKGARMATAGEFTMRSFLNGRMDLSQAEAVADLIASESEEAHQTAIKQMRGGYSEELSRLRQELIDFASLIELELDFAEEDVVFAKRPALIGLVNKIHLLIRDLLHSFQLGNVIKNGVATVIAGRPNAGKSTLLNLLLNEERAIVSEIAGTTRDVIEEVLNIQGIQFRLIDTAGIRDATDKIEAIGVAKTHERIAKAALLVYVFDAQTTTLETVKQNLENVNPDSIPVLLLANKMDQVGEGNYEQKLSEMFPEKALLAISANEKKYLPIIKNKLHQLVMSGNLSAPKHLLTNVRHFDALQKADTDLATVAKGLASELSLELIATDIRSAIHHLGLITGEVSTDDLLGNIFGKFCIGK